MMNLTERQLNDEAISIAVEGDLDLVSAPTLHRRLVGSAGIHERLVTSIDLDRCRFMDASGLTVLMQAGYRLDEHFRLLRLANVGGQPRRLLELTGIDRVRFIEVAAGDDLPRGTPTNRRSRSGERDLA